MSRFFRTVRSFSTSIVRFFGVVLISLSCVFGQTAPSQRVGCEAELRDPFDNDFDFSFSAIASEFARPVKYRKSAIGVAIHTDPDFDVVAAMLIGRDLQDQPNETV